MRPGNRVKLFCLTIIVLMVIGSVTEIRAQVLLKEGDTEYHLLGLPQYLEDSEDTLQIADVLRAEMIPDFKKFPSSDANFGFKQTVHWVRFQVTDSTVSPTTSWLLEVGYSAYANIDLYVVDEKGDIRFYQQAGDWRGTKSRPVPFHNYVFELPLKTKTSTVFLKLQPLIGQVIIPITIWETKEFIGYATLYQLFWGIYMGMLAIVLLYHAIVYFFNRKQKEYRGYLYLTLYLLTYLLFELTRGSCLGVRYLWPESFWWVNYGFINSFFFMMMMFMLFYSIILDIPTRMRSLFRVIQVFGVISIATLLFIDFGLWDVSKNAVSLTFGATAGIILIIAAIKSWRSSEGNQVTGLYYMIAAFTLYTGGIVMFLHRAGVIRGSHFITMNAMNLGSIVEFVALSIGLALRIRWQLNENSRLVAEKKKVILDTKKEETRRMTSAIHDYFGSQIVFLQGKVELLYQDYIDTLNHKRMAEVFDLIGEILDGIRLLAHSYVPYKLDEKGLRVTLKGLVWRYNELKKMGFDSHFSGTETGLSVEVQEEIYSIVIEVFTNIIKHSQAKNVALITYDEGDQYCLQIKDDGIGMNDSVHQGRGLENIRDRVAVTNGHHQFLSDPERGSVFILKVPFFQ